MTNGIGDGDDHRYGLPRVVRFLAGHAALGALAGCATAAALLFSDAGGLGTLLLRTSSPWPALALLFAGFGITFGSLAMGSAIMLLPKD